MIRIFVKYLTLFLISVFYRHKIYGKSHFPKGGGIIASNHCSFLDPPLIGASCPGKVHFLARETLFRFYPFAWLIRQLQTHPIRKGEGNAGTFKMVIDLVSNGDKVVIFPEGHRSTTGEFQQGQLGVGMLVYRTRCLVIPIYIHGTYDLWNNKNRFPKFWGKTALVFGTALDFREGFDTGMEKREIQAAIVVAIMDKIGELRTWYLAGAKGSPP